MTSAPQAPIHLFRDMGLVRHIGVIPNGERSHFFVGPDGRPPSFIVSPTEASPRRNVGQACDRFRAVVGVPVSVQRPLWVTSNSGDALRVYALEAHGPLPDRWRPIDELDLPGWAGRSERLIEALEGNDGSPPWYSPEHRKAVESWIVDVLGQRGETLAGPIRQIRHWTFSAVWLIESTRGRYFFKAGLPENHEPTKTRVIAEQWPMVTPVVVAVEPERGWLLTAEVSGISLSRLWEPGLWSQAAFEYGRVQVESLSVRSVLSEVANEARSMSDYYRDAQLLLEDDLLTEGPMGLTDYELGMLHAAAEPPLEALRQLTDLDDLKALDHGDFDAHQVVVVGSSIKVLDWGGAGFAHPLLDIENYLRTLHEGGRLRGKKKTWPRRLAYAAVRRLLRTLRREADDPTRRYHDRIFDAYMSAWEQHPMYRWILRSRPLVEEAFPLIKAVELWRTTKEVPNPWELDVTIQGQIRGELNL